MMEFNGWARRAASRSAARHLAGLGPQEQLKLLKQLLRPEVMGLPPLDHLSHDQFGRLM